VTRAERQAALEVIAGEVRTCTRCRLHETRTQAVPGEGDPSTEVVFVGEGPGFNEDRQGRPFVGRAGDLLVRLLGSIGWRREDVFITNVVKCRPPDNRDPEPDEIAACEPYLRRQLEVLDPAVVVTLGGHSVGRFMPGARIYDYPRVKYLFNRVFKRLWADSHESVVAFSARRGGPIYEAQSWNGHWDALDDSNYLYMGWDSKYMLTAVQGVLEEAGLASEVFVKYSYIGAVM